MDAGTVSAYTINSSTGALTEITGSPFAAGTYSFSVTVDPTGKFAYVVNESSDDIYAYTINSSTGALTEITGSPLAAGDEPRSVAVDPTGKFAYVANEISSDIYAYAINSSTGALTEITAIVGGNSPLCVTTIRIKQ
jgi:6-phosphogluconolactonase (cycloisomerase 2 family)